MEKEKLQKFLKELSELSKKHGIFITGCGCCGSPTLIEFELDEIEDDDLQNGDLKWNNFIEEYEYE